MLEHEDKKEILDAIQGLSTRMDEFGAGQQEMRGFQQEMRGSIKSLEAGQQEMRTSQQEMRGSIKSLEEGQNEMKESQQEMRGSIKSLEVGQQEMRTSQQEMRGSIKSLEAGQQEIHEMIQTFSTHVDERFEGVDRRLTKIEATMVTKDYLDDKLAQHGSHYGELIRQTNGKIELLTDSLVKEKSLSSASAKKVTSAEPFGRR